MTNTGSGDAEIEKTVVTNEITLRDLISIIWREKIWVILITIAVTGIAVVHALMQKEIFSTSTIFITKTGKSGGSGLSSLASIAGVSLGNSSDVDVADYLNIVVQDKEFLKKLLEKKWFYNNGSMYLKDIWELQFDSVKINDQYAVLKTQLDYIRGNKVIGNNKDKRTGIQTLTVNAPSAQLAYDINVEVIAQLSDYIRNSIKSQAKEKREFTEKRIAEVKEDLDKNENDLARFKERNIASSSPKLMLEEMRLTRQITINQEVYIQLQKQYEMTKIEELNDQPLVQIIKSPEIPLNRSKPDRRQIVVLGFLVGIIFGCIFAYVRFNYNIHFKTKN
jgi:uncharacterized protein involved in exopolysaccharide biosynthesis